MRMEELPPQAIPCVWGSLKLSNTSGLQQGSKFCMTSASTSTTKQANPSFHSMKRKAADNEEPSHKKRIVDRNNGNNQTAFRSDLFNDETRETFRQGYKQSEPYPRCCSPFSDSRFASTLCPPGGCLSYPFYTERDRYLSHSPVWRPRKPVSPRRRLPQTPSQSSPSPRRPLQLRLPRMGVSSHGRRQGVWEEDGYGGQRVYSGELPAMPRRCDRKSKS